MNIMFGSQLIYSNAHNIDFNITAAKSRIIITNIHINFASIYIHENGIFRIFIITIHEIIVIDWLCVSAFEWLHNWQLATGCTQLPESVSFLMFE